MVVGKCIISTTVLNDLTAPFLYVSHQNQTATSYNFKECISTTARRVLWDSLIYSLFFIRLIFQFCFNGTPNLETGVLKGSAKIDKNRKYSFYNELRPLVASCRLRIIWWCNILTNAYAFDCCGFLLSSLGYFFSNIKLCYD